MSVRRVARVYVIRANAKHCAHCRYCDTQTRMCVAFGVPLDTDLSATKHRLERCEECLRGERLAERLA